MLVVQGVFKGFPGTQALRGVSLEAREGEILALLGLNGAGKSTLVKILAGDLRPDAGQMQLEGRGYAPRSVKEGQELGVSVVHQQRTLIPSLTVAQNLHLGSEVHKWGLLRERAMAHEASDVLRRLGVEIDPYSMVSELGAGQQQLVDIAKAIKRQAKVLILDEPTAALTQHEAEHLFGVVRRLRAQGVATIFVSHRLDEVFLLCDRLVVLRDGVVVNAENLAGVSKPDVVRWMIGNAQLDQATAQHAFRPRPGSKPESMLHSRAVESKQALVRVTLTKPTTADQNNPVLEVRSGEVTGLAGQLGAGCTGVLEYIAGQQTDTATSLEVRGKRVRWRSPADAIASRIVLVPENRPLKAIASELSVRENMSLPSLKAFSRLGWIRRGKEIKSVKNMASRFSITMPDIEVPMKSLSGGNQQKTVFAKWLMAVRQTMSGGINGAVFLLDEPTEGVDVKTKPEIAQEIRQLANEGAGVLLASTDADELLGTCDRIYIMVKGSLIGEFNRDELDAKELSSLTMSA